MTQVSEDERKLLFNAVCKFILKDEYNEDEIKLDAPFGSKIGVDDSKLDLLLKHFKIFRMHAAFHDAFGHCKIRYDKGPGYSYIWKVPFNSCLLGHISGLFFWLFVSLFNRKLYRLF